MNFGNVPRGDAHGTIYDDVNGNGGWDLEGELIEPGLPGVTVYVDVDGNGQLSGDEPFAQRLLSTASRRPIQRSDSFTAYSQRRRKREE